MYDRCYIFCTLLLPLFSLVVLRNNKASCGTACEVKILFRNFVLKFVLTNWVGYTFSSAETIVSLSEKVVSFFIKIVWSKISKGSSSSSSFFLSLDNYKIIFLGLDVVWVCGGAHEWKMQAVFLLLIFLAKQSGVICLYFDSCSLLNRTNILMAMS